MSKKELTEAKGMREEELKEAYEKLINEREGLITAAVLADLEALQRAARSMGSVLNKQKMRQLDAALKGARDFAKSLTRLCEQASADLMGLDPDAAQKLIDDSREDHDLEEATLLESLLERRAVLVGHDKGLEAAIAKWEAAAANRQDEAVAQAHSELSDLLDEVKDKGFERSQSAALAKADDIIREYLEACAAATRPFTDTRPSACAARILCVRCAHPLRTLCAHSAAQARDRCVWPCTRYKHLDELVKKALDEGAVSTRDLKKALDRAQKAHLPLELISRALKIYEQTEEQRKQLLTLMNDDLMRADAINDWIGTCPRLGQACRGHASACHLTPRAVSQTRAFPKMSLSFWRRSGVRMSCRAT